MLLTSKWSFSLLLCALLTRPASSIDFDQLDLPKEHVPFYFKTFPKVADECRNDPSCPYKEQLDKDVCWGHEPNCPLEKAFQTPECSGDHKGWVQTKQGQINTFYSQADFGYLKEQMNQIKIMCEPLFREDSSLECSDHLQFCRGRNIMINFTDLAEEPARYKMDVLKPGQIGGYCTFHESRLKDQADHVSPLQSWAPEMRNFEKLLQRPIENGLCDVVVEKPTFIMKIDAAVNMYHHFCDFFNLYGSLLLNLTHPDGFTTDVNILIWETFTYHSSFSFAFKAFTENPILDLNEYRGKVVCFKSVVFPLLPRMIFGLFYNTPIIYGCEKSGLFKAFSQFMLSRLRVAMRDSEYHSPNFMDWDTEEKIRITFLSRATAYRSVLNEERLLDRLNQDGRFEVRKVIFNRTIHFRNQIETIQNSDIFIGMHGAGLTHLLFLPDWAVVFELYNCEDEHCYKDLARLRGVKYMTWRNTSAMIQQDEGHHPEGGAHAKFTNYEFDPDEFMKMINEAADHVVGHKLYKNYVKKLEEEKDEMTAWADGLAATSQVEPEDESPASSDGPDAEAMPSEDEPEEESATSQLELEDETATSRVEPDDGYTDADSESGTETADNEHDEL